MNLFFFFKVINEDEIAPKEMMKFQIICFTPKLRPKKVNSKIFPILVDSNLKEKHRKIQTRCHIKQFLHSLIRGKRYIS